jgi:mRNA-degrading endonuclease toxin of MazEF toxin-antitoxin module
VLVRFVFADELGAKRRPVLVLSGDAYHAGRQEVVVAAVTSNVGRLLPGDHLLRDWRQAGLPLPSVVTGILRTIKAPMVERALGRVAAADLRAVERALRAALDL